MNESKMCNSFKSYVGFEDDPQSLNTSADESFSDLNPRLLTGEMVIAEAQNVLLYTPVSEQKQGKSGTLSVTNFKLSFVTSEERPKEEATCQQNSLLAEYDICLSNVDIVSQIMGEKKRRLFPGTNVSGKVKGLHIVCKNMKVMTFSFRFSPVGHGKTLTNALLHHAFPRRHQLLFAYDFREAYYSCQQEMCWFREMDDWRHELARSGCCGWRLSAANQSFQLSTSLPQWLVVPATVLDWQLVDASRHFRANRPPVWCWGTREGAALVRMADLLPTITERTQENVMLENVRKSHPHIRQPVLLDLGRDVPGPKDVQISYCKLRDLCAPDSVRQFWMQDKDFLTQLEGTRWLHIVSACLGKGVEAAEAMYNGSTVVLQEGDGRDMCCVISSLVQILLDPHWRTHPGFRKLIQKEWVAMGHPFSSRLAHVFRADTDQSPVFLVFLDCVWQLLQQFPAAFEFTETFLTTLWDSTHISIFDTFLFDCERDRTLAAMDPHNPLIMRSIWDWGEQFSEQRDIALFMNPLFLPENGVLHPQHGVPMLAMWAQCYYRWVPLLEIPGGGKPQVDLQSRILLAEVTSLHLRLQGGDAPNLDKLTVQTEAKVDSFFPFSHGGSQPAALLSSSLALNSSFLPGEALLDSQSLLNAPD